MYDYQDLCRFVAWQKYVKTNRKNEIDQMASKLMRMVDEFRKNHSHVECKEYVFNTVKEL